MRIPFLIASIILTSYAFAFNTEIKEYSLNTPYHTIWTHLSYLQNSQYHPDIASKTLYAPNKTDEDKEKLAIQLKKVLDANNLYVYEGKLPKDSIFYDSIQKAHVFFPFKDYSQIYVKKYGGKWLFSESTVQAIPLMYQNATSWYQEKLMTFIPIRARIKVVGSLELWQILGLIIGFLVYYFLYKILNHVSTNIVLRKFIKDNNKNALKEILKPIISPLSLSFILFLIIPMISFFQIPVHLSHFLIKGIKILIYINIIVVCYRLVNLLEYYISKITSATESSLDDQVVPLIRKFLKVIVVMGGVLFILQSFDINITTLLAGLSIGGLAFAFAAQDTIKNLFGSVMIFIDRPFQIGDYIITNNVSGTVEEVGFRSTRVRTLQSTLVSIPNGALADQTIDNIGKRQFRRFNTTIGITYDTPPLLIESFIEGVKEIISIHPSIKDNSYEVHLNSMGDFSLNILIHMLFEVPSWSKELEAKHEILINIIKLGEKIGVNFAFPTQTLHVENLPGQKSLSPNYKKDDVKINNDLDVFLKEYKTNIQYKP